MTPDDNTPLGEARAWLRARAIKGERCPCCTQLAKVYRRKITAPSAVALITIYRAVGNDWVHVPTLLNYKGQDEAKMVHWGLIEEEPIVRPDGGRAGWWRITPFGQQFVLGNSTVPKYARLYDGRCLGLEGVPVTIRDCLGTKFNYADLMAGI